MTTQRCPVCQRLNRVPSDRAHKARCGACHAPLTPGAGSGPARPSGDLGARVIAGWEALVRHVPQGMGLAAATGQAGPGATNDPLTWLSAATQVPRDELDQIRLLRIHLASNKVVSQQVLTNAINTLDRANALMAHTHFPG